VVIGKTVAGFAADRIYRIDGISLRSARSFMIASILKNFSDDEILGLSLS
jgi:hypothetical protein